jgi:hypothetical protein
MCNFECRHAMQIPMDFRQFCIRIDKGIIAFNSDNQQTVSDPACGLLLKRIRLRNNSSIILKGFPDDRVTMVVIPSFQTNGQKEPPVRVRFLDVSCTGSSCPRRE